MSDGSRGTRPSDDNGNLAADPEPRARDIVTTANAPLLDRSMRWEQIAPKDFQVPRYVADTMPMHLDPNDWNTGFLAVHERELPPELFDDLHQLSPQASLRDLFRPVESFYVTPTAIEGTQLIGRWKEGVEDIKRARQREPLPVLDPSLREMAAAQVRWQALRDQPWTPLLDDAAPRKKLNLYPGEDPNR